VKIYTRTGDEGETSLFGGARVKKTHPRVEACGTVDELNAVLGLAASHLADDDLRARLACVQARLFDVGADLAAPPGERAGGRLTRTSLDWVDAMEAEIDAMAAELPALDRFILPGGTPGAAALHLARTVCRRAERRVVEAAEAGEEITPVVGKYLNRLGDWLFVTARRANALGERSDVVWEGGARTPSTSSPHHDVLTS